MSESLRSLYHLVSLYLVRLWLAAVHLWIGYRFIRNFGSPYCFRHANFLDLKA
jgi:hypothetical protein